jgi:peptidyl-prolyl cis-trans isomerase D
MNNKFTSKSATIMVSGMLFLITLSFILTGFQSDISFVGGSSTDVATVDGNGVTMREYQFALNQQLDFYRRMVGGKDLTEAQIEQFGIRQMVLKRLVEKKLLENFGKDNGLYFSQDKLAKTIKELPYFKRDNQFDVNLYKNLLAQNGFNPSQFEEQIAHDESARLVDTSLNSLSITSDNYSKLIHSIEEDAFMVNAVQFSKESLRKSLKVETKAIETYLANAENKKKLTDIYNQNIGRFSQAEQVKARHILIKSSESSEAQAQAKAEKIAKSLTAQNFASIANKETEDPSGKGKGGELGWFGRGRMVPEFEAAAFSTKVGQISKPVKTQFGYHIIMVEGKKDANQKSFDQVKAELATEEIQKGLDGELDQYFEKMKIEVKAALNDTKKMDQLASTHAMTFNKSQKVSRLSKAIGSIQLTAIQNKSLFNENQTKVVKDFSDAAIARIVYVDSRKSPDVANMKVEELKAVKQKLNSEAVRSIRDDLMVELEASAKVVSKLKM